MTDREMLELAARAGGYARHEYVENSARDGRVVTGHYDSLLEVCINPLTDDGDALRLAVKLCIGLDHNHAGDQQRYVAASRPGCEGCFSPVCAVEDEFDESQRAAATRRAIVRAAAEIGRQMEETT